MIQVTYCREIHRLTMEGHAGAGELGHDLVCCAASMLAHTLGANVQHLEEQGYVQAMRVDLHPGDTEIECTPAKNWEGTVTLIFDTVCAGFDLLARDYPENISYKIL